MIVLLWVWALVLVVNSTNVEAQALTLLRPTPPDFSIPDNYSALGCNGGTCAGSNRLRFQITNNSGSTVLYPDGLYFTMNMPNVVVRFAELTDPLFVTDPDNLNDPIHAITVTYTAGASWNAHIEHVGGLELEDQDCIVIDVLVDVECGIITDLDDYPFQFTASFEYFLGPNNLNINPPPFWTTAPSISLFEVGYPRIKPHIFQCPI